MTPVSDLRRFSKNLPLSRVAQLQSAIPRSQSDTSYSSLASVMDKKPRRGSDWSETMKNSPQDFYGLRDELQVLLRPLQTGHADYDDDSETSSLLHRRMSKVIMPSKSTSSNSSTNAKYTSSRGITRSQSVRMTKRNGDIRQRHRGSSIPSEVGASCTGVKVKERTVSNRSLPLPGDEGDYMRLRNFSITSKGVINRGDSFRCRSTAHVPSVVNEAPLEAKSQTCNPGVQADTTEKTPPTNFTPVYKVLLIGAPDVGKTSLRNQFMTSEYICAYDSPHDEELDRTVTINLNNEESELEFFEEALMEENVLAKIVNECKTDAYIIVYSVTNRRSYLQARQFLCQLEPYTENKVVILVGNKTDLARIRTVSTEEGRSLAKERGCKFIETSVAINHQVDELLVGILTQIRMKVEQMKKQEKKKKDNQNRKSSIYPGSKASDMLKKILRRACLKSKSCDNLHVL